MRMPNKTIYVPDVDLPVFDQAQSVSGKNLSATIVQALRFFIKIGEGKGFQQVEITEGENGFYKKKRFIGRELASARVFDEPASVTTNYTVYETAHGRYAVWIREGRILSLEESIERELQRRILEKIAGSKQTAAVLEKEDDEEPTTEKLEVYDSLEALIGHVPVDLIRSVRQIKDGEFLDI